jgi:RNA recognition motif-containing protein
MKSWADHCSSDEESEGGHRRKSEPVNDDDNAERNIVTAKETTRDEAQDDVKGNNDDDAIPPPLPLADFPTNYPQFQEVIQDLQGPPYSAHVGNLSFRIQTNEQLSRTLEGLVDYRYQGQEKVHVSSARIALDRETKKPRGFANVYFDTIDEVGIVNCFFLVFEIAPF